MGQKKIKHQQIENESKRKTVFRKRSDSLIKKAEELSILCGAEVGLIIEKPMENQAIFWPTPEAFWQMLQKFVGFSELERTKKMMDLESYLEQRVKDEQKLVLKIDKKNEEKEAHALINQIYQQGMNINDLDMKQLSLVREYSAELISKLKKRRDALDQSNKQPTPPLALPPPGAPTGGVQTPGLDNNLADLWFVNEQGGVDDLMGIAQPFLHYDN